MALNLAFTAREIFERTNLGYFSSRDLEFGRQRRPNYSTFVQILPRIRSANAAQAPRSKKLINFISLKNGRARMPQGRREAGVSRDPARSADFWPKAKNRRRIEWPPRLGFLVRRAMWEHRSVAFRGTILSQPPADLTSTARVGAGQGQKVGVLGLRRPKKAP